MDLGFVGPAYTAANPDQDAQELINWMLEKSTSEKSKETYTLLGTPGLVQKVAAATGGEVRGGWELPGELQALWVIGNGVYLMTCTPATVLTQAGLSISKVGTMASSAGQVCIRDNGAGGIAVIVDGTSAGYVYNIKNQTLNPILDQAFYGSDRISFIDGWLVFNKPGTQIFYTSPVYWNGTDPLDATYFALKDSSSDNLVTHTDSLRELWLIGERTSEIWYDAGNTAFPFSRLQGVSLQIGCAAKHSLCKFGKGLIWLARSERGQNVVVATEGYSHDVVSSPAVSNALNTYNVVSDAIGYSYSEGGHTFYVLTLPTANVTWVYDAQSREWHKRAYFDQTTGLNNRHMGNCCINFQNMRLVGDFQNGSIYAMSRTVYSDNGNPLVALRRTAHIWDGDKRERVFHESLQVQIRAGQGLQTGQGQTPTLMVRWSDDSAQTWSSQRSVPVGSAGKTKNRAITRRLGQSRDRIYEFSISDPVNRDVIGATLEASK